MIPNQVETCIRSFSPQYLVRWCPLSDYFEIVHLGYLSTFPPSDCHLTCEDEAIGIVCVSIEWSLKE